MLIQKRSHSRQSSNISVNISYSNDPSKSNKISLQKKHSHYSPGPQPLIQHYINNSHEHKKGLRTIQRTQSNVGLQTCQQISQFNKKQSIKSENHQSNFLTKNPSHHNIKILGISEKGNIGVIQNQPFKKINMINTKILFSNEKNLHLKPKTHRAEKENISEILIQKKKSQYQSTAIIKNKSSVEKTFEISTKNLTNFKQKITHKCQQQHQQSISRFVTETKKLVPITKQNFIIGRRLGKGNFGEVFLVKNKTNGFVCAMKIISKAKIIQQKIQQQIERQLKIHSYLKHINIVQLYGFFADSQNLYVLQQICTGGHLYDLIKKKRRLSEEYTAYLIKQTLQGLLYIHQKKVLHRDLKPQNILLENGIVKICDFGWSVYSFNNMQKSLCGTPLYLSPEIIKGETYDQKIDIWSVGILAYQLLFGRIPFTIWCEQELYKIVHDSVVFPDFVDITQNAKDFILRALEKNPKNRLSIKGLLEHPFITRTNLKNEQE